ncbi:MAG: hypothetical protein AAEC03_05205 [Synechococcus sp.]
MTSCPWPRRQSPLARLRDWWTPPIQASTSREHSATDERDRMHTTLMNGGFWLS